MRLRIRRMALEVVVPQGSTAFPGIAGLSLLHGVVLAVAMLGVCPRAGAQPSLERFVGEYRVTLSTAQVAERIEQAIDRGVDGLFFAIRGIGASRVRAKSPPIHGIRIQVTGGSLSVTFRNRRGSKRYVAPRDGATVKARAPDGEPVRLNLRMAGGDLVQHFTSEDGQRINRFHLSKDGNRLALTIEITSSQLGAPVRYVLPFRRVETAHGQGSR